MTAPAKSGGELFIVDNSDEAWIDERVYRLCGLTKEESKTVEESLKRA